MVAERGKRRKRDNPALRVMAPALPLPVAAALRPGPDLESPVASALVDSGPLLALFNAGDHWHVRVLAWLAAHPETRLVSTWSVLTEVCALLARRIHNEAALDFLRWVQRGAVEIDSPEAGSLPAVLAISERFASLPFDLADASVAEAAGRRRIRHVLSVDADFIVYRDQSGRPLTSVLWA